ncbi:MAG: hypothetical protein P9M14_14255 [Candidatus Alcyoniella australis]|nr:hypothetical protein [Candidatus Alcyoniella australis]
MLRALVTICCLTALSAWCGCCAQTEPTWPATIELHAQIHADPTGRVTVSGQSNLPEGTTLQIVIRGGEDLGCNVAQGLQAQVLNGRYLVPTTLDLPLDYRALVSLTPGPNPQWAAHFDQQLCDSAPAEHLACLKGPEGAFRLNLEARGRLGSEQAAATLAREHLDRLKKKLRALDYEAEALDQALSPGDPTAMLSGLAARLRLRADKERSLGLAGPERDLLYPQADQQLIEAWQALELMTALRVALCAGDADEIGRLKGADQGFQRRREQAAATIEQIRTAIQEAPASEPKK